MSMQVNNDGDNVYANLKAGERIEDLKRDQSNWEKYGPLFEMVDQVGTEEGVLEQKEIDVLKSIKQMLVDMAPETVKNFIEEWKSSGDNVLSFVSQKFIVYNLQKSSEAQQKYEKTLDSLQTEANVKHIVEQLRISAENDAKFQEKLKQIEDSERKE